MLACLLFAACQHDSTSTSISPDPSVGGVADAAAPQVLYTDLLSGPNAGGENNKGAYLSVFGFRFGRTGLGSRVRVYINNVEVDNYRYLGPSQGRSDVDQITVQVGALGNPTPGVGLPVKVVVDGRASNTNLQFTVNPGRILFVDNVQGNDATALIGDVAHPFRYVQTPALTTGGAWPQVQPGDVVVLRGHGAATPWTDVGFENYFLRFRDKSGSAPTGSHGTGPITVQAYPGETVLIRGLLANGMTGGCISGINGQNYPDKGKWVVIAGLKVDCEGYDGPISQQIAGDHWRVINNDLSASTAPRTGPDVPRMAGITGNGQNAVWLGNHIHDIQGSYGECHGLYIDGDGSYEIAYNLIEHIRDGNGINLYANGGNGSDVINQVNLHHNRFDDISKHGVNIADGSRAGIRLWSNVISQVDLAAIRFNSTDLQGVAVYHNTFYNTNRLASPLYGALTNDWSMSPGSVDIQNNIFWVVTGTPYNSGSNGVPASAGLIRRNLWFNGDAPIDVDTAPLAANPLFHLAGSDFQLQAASPAKGLASRTAAIQSVVSSDYFGQPLAQTADIGAIQSAP